MVTDMPHYVTQDTSIEVADASAYAAEFEETKTILLVGVGGQGTILAGNILAMTAAEAGLDVKVSEIHGMSQRGGSVSTTIRVGKKVNSMVAYPGSAQVLVAFERMEALRYQHYLAPEGHLFVNDTSITPVPVNIGAAKMPQRMTERLGELGAIRIDADGIAERLGSPKSANVVLVGALSCALPFSADEWRDAIARRVPPKTIEANLAAFEEGRGAAQAQGFVTTVA
jgi:indolepyruvate ferredoxin oxidoreductase beta subunit